MSEIGGKDAVGENQESIRGLPRKEQEWLDEKKWEAFGKMEEMGLLEIKEEKGEKLLVFEDLDLFRNKRASINVNGQERELKLSVLIEKVALPIKTREGYGDKRTDRSMFWMFEDTPVITRHDYDSAQQNGEELPLRKLFYIPKSSQEALDPEILSSISTEEFYLTFQDVSRYWGDVYPTETERFNSGLTNLEVVAPYLVYGLGRGRREKDGSLTVLGDLSESGERRPLSSLWFIKNFGIKYKNIDRANLRKIGVSLDRRGVIRVSDLPEKSSKERFEVSKKGTWFYDNRRFHIGTEYAGGRIERLNGDKFVVWKIEKGARKPLLLFDAVVPSDKQQLVNMVSGGGSSVYADVPKDAFWRRSADSLGTLGVSTYRVESGPRFKKYDRGAELARLLSFRREYEQKVGDVDEMAYLDLDDQIAAMMAIREFDKVSRYDVWSFVNTSGLSGLQVLADGFFYGGVDERILKLGAYKSEEVQALLELYKYVDVSVNRFKDAVTNSIVVGDDYSSVERSTTEVFMSRVAEAFKLRARDFLVGYAIGEEAAALNQMSLLSRSLGAVESIFSAGEYSDYKLAEKPINYDKETGEATSVTGRYMNEVVREVNNLTEIVVITVRPKAIQGKWKGQARFSVKYSTTVGEELSFRVDLDLDKETFGTALDIGSVGQEMVDLLEKVGKTHHTEEPFEGVFESPKVFERIMLLLAKNLGYDFSPKPRKS